MSYNFSIFLVLFRQWIEGRTDIVKPEDVDTTVSALPAYLSRRAVDLNGHRGKKRGKNKQYVLNFPTLRLKLK